MNKTSFLILIFAAIVLSLVAPLGRTVKADSAGPNNAGTGSSDYVNPNWFPWSDPGNITAADELYAKTWLPEYNVWPQATTQYLRGSNYGFSIPSGVTIRGIKVDIRHYISSSEGHDSHIQDYIVRLVKAGNVVGDNKAIANYWTNKYPEIVTYGGQTDLWGTTWTPSDINDNNFGVILSARNNNSWFGEMVSVDYMQITVYYYVTNTITYDANGGTNPPTDPNSPYNYGSTVTVLGAGSMTRTGYTFSNWNTAANGSGTSYNPGDTFVIQSNVTLYAIWNIINNTITYDANGGTNPPTDPNSPYNYGSTVTVLGAGSMTRTGYTFSNWNTAANGSGTSYNTGDTFTITSDITLYAQWSINTYIITATSGLNGSISPSGNITIIYGNNQTFNFYPNSGYRVADVLVDGISQGKITSYTFTNVTSNHTIHVTFEVDCIPFFDTKTDAIICFDLGTSLAPRWRVIIPSRNYDTGWMSFSRYTSLSNRFWGEYTDARYHFIIDFTYPNRYHIIFNDRLTRISIKIAN